MHGEYGERRVVGFESQRRAWELDFAARWAGDRGRCTKKWHAIERVLTNDPGMGVARTWMRVSDAIRVCEKEQRESAMLSRFAC